MDVLQPISEFLVAVPWPSWQTLGLAAIGVVLFVNIVLAVYLVISIPMCRPWSPEPRLHSEELSRVPYPIFAFGTKVVRLAELYLQTKPAPLRLAEVGTAYMQSQALFVVMNLGVAEQLQKGPKTPYELAAAAGPNVNPDWLARVLKLAAELGVVRRTRRPSRAPQPLPNGRTVHHPTANGRAHDNGRDDSNHTDQNGIAHHCNGVQAEFACPDSGCNDLYSATGVSALLCRDAPNTMVDFMKLVEYNYSYFAYLSEGIQTGQTPFNLWSGGPSLWEHMHSNPDFAATFDGAMRATNHTGAKMAVEQYNWGRIDVVVDIAGGNGQFLAEIMQKHPKLQGVLLDREGQVQRGKKWWEADYPHLLPRMQFVVGDMFDPSTIPSPRPGKKTLYVLKQILHDWSDTDSLAILKSIRAVISEEDAAAGRASLAVLEVGTVETINPDLLQHRLEADMGMLVCFGDGKERDEHQTRVLLDAAGFKLHRMVGTTGLMIVMEAKAVPLPAAGKKAATAAGKAVRKNGAKSKAH